MDVEIILKRLKFMSEKLKDIKYDLEKYNQTSNKRELKTLQAALERWAEEVVECAITINNEILEDANKFSDSYYNSFMNLEDLNIFNKNTLEKLASTAGFRNRLAHEYMNLDDKITIESIKSILKSYKEYILKISEFIQNV